MRKEVLESDETSVLRRLQQRLALDVKLQTDWQLNWGFLVSGSAPDENDACRGYEVKDRLQCQLERNKEPKSKYARAVLSSHLIGWSANVELFGVAQHKRLAIDEDLHANCKPWRIMRASSGRK